MSKETSKEYKIARVCHEANRAYCETIGDNSFKPWNESPLWQKESSINGVKFHLDNPHANPSSTHLNWLKEKERTGWKYGEVKDENLKTHPCFLPYDKLPEEQKKKDYLFKAIVDSLR